MCPFILINDYDILDTDYSNVSLLFSDLHVIMMSTSQCLGIYRTQFGSYRHFKLQYAYKQTNDNAPSLVRSITFQCFIHACESSVAGKYLHQKEYFEWTTSGRHHNARLILRHRYYGYE